MIKFGSHKLHGLFLNAEGVREKFVLAAVETMDNQLDFNAIHVTNRPPAEDFDYELRQYRENVPRDVTVDPIQKFKTVFTEMGGREFNFSGTVRRSGAFDIYFNGFKVYSSA